MKSVMDIDEAIEVLQKDIDDTMSVMQYDRRRAEALGVEALERVRLWQSVTSGSDKHYLPSQTRDCLEPQPTPSPAPHEPLTWGGAWGDARATLGQWPRILEHLKGD